MGRFETREEVGERRVVWLWGLVGCRRVRGGLGRA